MALETPTMRAAWIVSAGFTVGLSLLLLLLLLAAV
jgi:hypothetical protein